MSLKLGLFLSVSLILLIVFNAFVLESTLMALNTIKGLPIWAQANEKLDMMTNDLLTCDPDGMTLYFIFTQEIWMSPWLYKKTLQLYRGPDMLDRMVDRSLQKWVRALLLRLGLEDEEPVKQRASVGQNKITKNTEQMNALKAERTEERAESLSTPNATNSQHTRATSNTPTTSDASDNPDDPEDINRSEEPSVDHKPQKRDGSAEAHRQEESR